MPDPGIPNTALGIGAVVKVPTDAGLTPDADRLPAAGPAGREEHMAMSGAGRARGAGLALGLLVAAAGVARAQGFMVLALRADTAEQQQRYGDAARLYERAYGESGFEPLVLALAAADFAKAGATDSAFIDLNRAVDEGYLDPGYFTRDSDTFVLHGDPRWAPLEAKLSAKRAALDSGLMKELLALADSDQAARQGMGAVITRYGRASPQADSVLRALDASDAPRLARIQAIVTEHGWPGRSLVGDPAAHAAWVLVQHAPLDYQKQVLPLLLAAVSHDDARAGDGALLQDRVLVGERKAQLYGTQTHWSATPGPPVLEPISDEACVDVRRRSVGLEPLADYLRSLGIQYFGPPGVCTKH